MRSSWLYLATRSERAGAPVLIWPVVEGHCRVGDGGVFGLTGTVGGNRTQPAGGRSPRPRSSRSGSRSGSLDQQGVAGVLADTAAHTLGIGPRGRRHDLQASPTSAVNISSRPSRPGQSRLRSTLMGTGRSSSSRRRHLFTAEHAAFFTQVVLVGLFVVQLGSRRIEGDGDCSPALYPAFSMLQDDFHSFHVGLQRRA